MPNPSPEHYPPEVLRALMSAKGKTFLRLSHL
jgi:hypothetical protein